MEYPRIKRSMFYGCVHEEKQNIYFSFSFFYLKKKENQRYMIFYNLDICRVDRYSAYNDFTYSRLEYIAVNKNKRNVLNNISAV